MIVWSGIIISSLPFMCGIQWYFQNQPCPVNTISCPIISRSFSQIHKFFRVGYIYFDWISFTVVKSTSFELQKVHDIQHERHKCLSVVKLNVVVPLVSPLSIIDTGYFKDLFSH